MIRHVLVAVDGSDHARSAVDHAVWLSQRFRASITALHVIDVVSIEGSFLHDISGSLGFEPYLDFSSRMRDVLEERGRAMLAEVRDHVAAAGVECETRMEMGIVANEICEQARTSDVVVLGHRGVNEKFSSGLLGSTVESVSRKSPGPVLVCPLRFEEPRRPLLAYDGSQRSSSAMQAAAEFCEAAGLPLTVVHAARDEAAGQKVLAEATRYLEPYGIETEVRVVGEHAPERIVEALRDGGHDLLFIGAYGHSRILEMVIGSTTEYVLRNAPGPVFLHR